VPLQELGLQILRRKIRHLDEGTSAWPNHESGAALLPLSLALLFAREKQTLCHLAQDRRLSHRDPDIEALLKRELIVRDEGLHLFNESFAKFVLAASNWRP
jgi:hypothetical protein